MRRHSTWLLLVVTIVIFVLVVENEVTASPAPAPAPCFGMLRFGMEPDPFRRPKEDKEKDKREKLKKARDNLFDDFKKFLALL